MNEGLSRAGTLTLLALFFAWGHVSVMLDMAIPSIKSAFSLSYRDVMLVQSAFFLAYLFLSIPAGMLVSRLGFRLGAVIGLANALGTAFGPVVASITFLSAAHAVQTHSLSAVGDLFVGISLSLVLLGLIATRSLHAVAGGKATGTDGTHPFDRFARLRLAAGSLAIFAHAGTLHRRGVAGPDRRRPSAMPPSRGPAPQ